MDLWLASFRFWLLNWRPFVSSSSYNITKRPTFQKGTIMSNPNANQPNQNAHKYFQPHVVHNNKQLQFIRSCFAAIAGSAAGILGLTNWSGFLFYALSWSTLSILLVVFKCHHQPGNYFMHGIRELVVDGAINGLLSYILFHTFLFGLVHLYQ